MSAGKTGARVVVVGSLNVDFTARVERLPKPGETVLAMEEYRSWGGKGANQALAAARQGGEVEIIGAVGSDPLGEEYRRVLGGGGVGVGAVETVAGETTGRAWILVDNVGENSIVVLPGANRRLGMGHVEAQSAAVARADLLIVQWETTMEAAMAATRLAWDRAIPILWNPSPWRGDFPWGEGFIDFVVVNEGEAEALLGFPLAGRISDCVGVRERMDALRVGGLIVTRGGQSTWFFSLRETFESAAFSVTPVDTVGAGDAFAGALAVELARGVAMREAVEYANAAGALATLAAGAQAALPTRAATESWIRASGRASG